MELTARVQALVAELQLADAIIERDQPRSDLIHLEVVGDSLQFTSQGHSLLLRTTCPVKVASGGAIAVPMRRLLAYLQLFPADAEMGIAATENDTAKVTLVRSETRIPGLAGESYDVGLESRLDTGQPAPAVSMPKERMELPADLLLEALNHTIFSVADEQSHYTIEGAQLIVHRDKIGMVSTDGHRLSLYMREVSVGTVREDVQCLIGRKAMTELKRILEQCEASDDEPARVECADGDARAHHAGELRRHLDDKPLADDENSFAQAQISVPAGTHRHTGHAEQRGLLGVNVLRQFDEQPIFTRYHIFLSGRH